MRNVETRADLARTRMVRRTFHAPVYRHTTDALRQIADAARADPRERVVLVKVSTDPADRPTDCEEEIQ